MDKKTEIMMQVMTAIAPKKMTLEQALEFVQALRDDLNMICSGLENDIREKEAQGG